jgi:hypothetical protein
VIAADEVLAIMPIAKIATKSAATCEFLISIPPPESPTAVNTRVPTSNRRTLSVNLLYQVVLRFSLSRRDVDISVA